jgi:hypothetical protein
MVHSMVSGCYWMQTGFLIADSISSSIPRSPPPSYLTSQSEACRENHYVIPDLARKVLNFGEAIWLTQSIVLGQQMELAFSDSRFP